MLGAATFNIATLDITTFSISVKDSSECRNSAIILSVIVINVVESDGITASPQCLIVVSFGPYGTVLERTV